MKTTLQDQSFAAELSLKITTLQVNGMRDPMGIDQTPLFGWTLTSKERGRSQTAYRLSVASAPDRLPEGDIWDSGRVGDSKTADIPYAGPALSSKTAYFWCVQVWDDRGQDCGCSPVASFETGMLKEEDWIGSWISDDVTAEPRSLPLDGCRWIWGLYGKPMNQVPAGALWFRKRFRVSESRPLVRALFGFTADDKGTAYLNGEKLGETDGWLAGEVYDITDRLTAGENLLAVEAYNAKLGYSGLIGRLRIQYADGTDEILTDGSWRLTDTLTDGWEQPGFDDTAWIPPDQAVPYGDAPWGTRVRMETDPLRKVSAPLFRKEFAVKSEVQSARLYICGLGLYDLKINGEQPDDTVLNPAHTQYEKTVLYRVYDVTRLLHTGQNAIGVELGKSFYNETVHVWNWQNAVWRDVPKLILQIELSYSDGTRETVCSGADWKAASNGPTVFDSIYYGETYDARLKKSGYDLPGYWEDSSWHPVKLAAPPKGALKFQQMEPMRRVARFTPCITRLKDDSYILRNPEMTTGWIKLSVSAPKGTEITITYGERLRADGSLNMQGNDSWFERIIQQDRYICGGEDCESFEPRFSYKGYQYIQIDGYPGELTQEQIEAYAIHNDIDQTSDFSCSEPLVNGLHALARRTMLNNFQGKPTDTPVWEKNGWTGDANVSTEMMAYNFDIRALLSQFVCDMEDAQTPEGIVPTIAPSAMWGVENVPTWTAIFVLAPLQLYHQFGMKQFLRERYDSMRKQVLYGLQAIEKRGWISPDDQLADWVSPASLNDPHARDVAMPTEGSAICNTGYFYRMLTAMAEIAELFGKTADAAEYRDAMAKIYQAFNEKFYKKELDCYQTDFWREGDGADRTRFRQTSQLVPLAFGLVPEEYKAGVLEKLVADIEQKGCHLDTGMVGTKLLLPVLSDNGYAELAYRVLTQTAYPSWGYWLLSGSTAAWESYETTTRSLDHYFLSTYDEWLFKGLAGIRDFAEGGRTLTIRPQIVEDLSWVSARTQTGCGLISSGWKRSAEGVRFDLVIPVGTTAEVMLPVSASGAVRLTDGTALEAGLPGILAVTAEETRLRITLGSGSYSFFAIE